MKKPIVLHLENMKPRENWSSRLGLLMATAGSAIGLGSLWKFPYVTGANGGGIFIFAYLIFTFLIAVPLFIAEMLVGRHTQRSPVVAYTTCNPHKPNWRILGWLSALSCILILSFYSVVAGWSLCYALMSLVNFTQGKETADISAIFDTLNQSGNINLLITFLFIGITTAIVYKGIKGGIEFWSKILTPALLIMLLLLFLYGTTLPGFRQAVSFILLPDASKLKPSSFLEALGLACFTLSVGMGIILTYGSYMTKKDDIPKTAFTIASVDVVVSMIAALLIFPIIFSFGFTPEEGPGLLFKTMPVLFAKLPGTLLLSTVFFLLVFFAALTSAISMLEVIVATITDTHEISRPKATLIIASLLFILAIPSALSGSQKLFPQWDAIFGKSFFGTMDALSFNWVLPLNALFTSIYAGWIIESKIKSEAFLAGTSWIWLFRPWAFFIRWVVPLGVIAILLHEGGIIDIDVLFRRH